MTKSMKLVKAEKLDWLIKDVAPIWNDLDESDRVEYSLYILESLETTVRLYEALEKVKARERLTASGI